MITLATRRLAQKAAWLAEQAAKEKRYNDSVAQVKYVKLMSEYKTMENSGSVQFKQLSSANLQLKPLSLQTLHVVYLVQDLLTDASASQQ